MLSVPQDKEGLLAVLCRDHVVPCGPEPLGEGLTKEGIAIGD